MVAGLGDLLSQQLLSCYHLLTTLKTETTSPGRVLPWMGYMPLGILASFLAFLR